MCETWNSRRPWRFLILISYLLSDSDHTDRCFSIKFLTLGHLSRRQQHLLSKFATFRLRSARKRKNMQGGEELSIEELTSNISTYKEQLQQVKMLLADDPGNSEYKDMENELEEVIALTEELLATTKQNEDSISTMGASASASKNSHNSNLTSQHEMDSISMLDQLEKFPIGTKVQAVWSEDGEWYDARIQEYTPNGYYVCFDEWGNSEEIDPTNVRPLQDAGVNALVEAEKEAEATRQALKRKIAQAAVADFQSRSIPAKLRINPDDPEDVKATKRKKIHAFKSKVRVEQLEVAQNKRQNAWQQFQSAKGRAKKVGFFSGRKRESIFKSPDDPYGKVGVTGSGKGLTEFQKREKHLHLKGANIEGDNAGAEN